MRSKKALLVVAMLMLAALTTIPAFAAAYAYSGNIASGAQYDLYTINLIAGEQVTATLVCDEMVPGSRPLDPVLSVYFPGASSDDTSFASVYDDDGFGLDDAPDGVDCNAFDSSRAIFTAPVTGAYIFRADGFGSATGPYTLTIRTGGSSSDGRINPQNDAPIVLYCNAGSTDFYSVTGVYLGAVANGGSGAFGGANVTALGDGRMQLTAGLPDGKTYLLIWTGCDRGSYEAYNINNGVATRYASGSY